MLHNAHTPFADYDPDLANKPGLLGKLAASLLMKLFYGARVTWPHFCYIVASLACQTTK